MASRLVAMPELLDGEVPEQLHEIGVSVALFIQPSERSVTDLKALDGVKRLDKGTVSLSVRQQTKLLEGCAAQKGTSAVKPLCVL